MISPIQTPGLLGLSDAGGTPATGPAGVGGFLKVIEGFLAQANGQEAVANDAVRDLAMGQTDNLHQVLLEVAKSDISFRLILEIRNRLSDAFQEIMRMSI